MIGEFIVHTYGEVPDISFGVFNDFVTVNIKVKGMTVKYFLNNLHDIVSFKNRILWAEERMSMGEK